MIRKRKRKLPPSKAGRTGRSLVSKKPWKSREHLDRVKAQPCLMNTPYCSPVVDPHHCRKLLPEPGHLLPRDDRLTVPLCRRHHRGMDGNERAIWAVMGIDPTAWISNFSAEGKAAIEALPLSSS